MKVYFQGAGLLKDVTSYVTSFSTSAEMKSGKLIGNAVSLMVDISFNNLSGILDGAASGDFYIDANQADSIDTPVQRFVVMDAPERYTSKLQLTLYDEMVKLNSPYKSGYTYADGGYPTIAQQLAEIETLAGVAINTAWLPAAVLNKVAYWIDTTTAMRDYIAMIAELAGCNAYANSSNQICFKRLLADRFTAFFASDFDKSDLLTITQVVFDDGIARYAAGSPAGKTLYLSPNNPYIDSQNAVDAILDLYDNVSFCPLESMKTFGQDGMAPGCLVTYDNIPCIVTSVKRSFHGEGSSVVLNGTVSNENGDKVTVINDATRFKQLRTIIDQEAGRLSIVSENVDDNTARIGSLEISAEGFRTSIEDIRDEQQGTVIRKETLYLVNSGITPNRHDAGWARNPAAVSPGKHLWQMEVTEYLSGRIDYSDPVDLTSGDVIGMTQYYTLSLSPDRPLSSALYLGNGFLLTSQTYLTTESEGWTTVQPSLSSGQYLWERWKIEYSDGTVIWSEPVCAKWYRDLADDIEEKTTLLSTEILATNDRVSLKADLVETNARFNAADQSIERLRSEMTSDLQVVAGEISAEVRRVESRVDGNDEEIAALQYTKTYVKEDGLYVEDSDSDSKTRITGDGLRVLDNATNATLLETTSDGVVAEKLTAKSGLVIQSGGLSMRQAAWHWNTANKDGIAIFITEV